MHNIKISKLVTRHIQLIEKLYHMFDTYVDKSKLDANEVEEIESEYHNLIQKYGAQILSVTRIIRTEMESPTILKNADFSLEAIKKLIAEGERKATNRIDAIKNKKTGL
jgi:NTE family protein